MRLFVAVELPEEVIAALAAVQQEIRNNVVRGRFKRTENFHLTLKFLGEVPPDALDKLTQELSLAAQSQMAFTLQLGKPGVFGAGQSIRVIWQGLSGDTARLASLQQAVEAACAAAGFARDKRPYSPHITLAQDVIPTAGKPYLPNNPPALAFVVSEFALVLSEERDRKRIYTPLQHFLLPR